MENEDNLRLQRKRKEGEVSERKEDDIQAGFSRQAMDI